MWITLIPRTEIFSGGTKTMVDEDPRAPQEFWLIWQGDNPIVVDSTGTTRKLDFVLVGNWDAEVAVNDHWQQGTSNCVITYIAPNNGYEVKCGGEAIGGHP